MKILKGCLTFFLIIIGIIVVIAIWLINGAHSPKLMSRKYFYSSLDRLLFDENIDMSDVTYLIGDYSRKEHDAYIWNNYELVKGFYGQLEVGYSPKGWMWKLKNYSPETVSNLEKKLSEKWNSQNVSTQWNIQNDDTKRYMIYTHKGHELFLVDSGTDLTISYDPKISRTDEVQKLNKKQSAQVS